MSKYVERVGLNCLEIVLKKSFCKNGDWLRDLTKIFESCGVITEEKLSEVNVLLSSNCHNEHVVELLIHSLQERKVEKKCINKACKRKAFPGGSVVANGIQYFGTAAVVSESLRWLVMAWNELCVHKVPVQAVIAENWKDYYSQEENPDYWPLEFIMKCTMYSEADKIIKKIKALLEQIALEEFHYAKASELEGAGIPKEKDIVSKSIAQIFQRYLVSEEDKISKLLSLFGEFDLLSANNLSTALKDAEHGKFSDTQLMHLILTNSPTDWKKKMSAACQNEEFPGDKAFASIILTLLKNDIQDEIQWLISVRDQLDQSQMLIDKIIPASWKEQYDLTMFGKFWPEHLIEICITFERMPEINQFIEKVKEILEKKTSAAEDRYMPDIEDLKDNDSSYSFESVDFEEKEYLYESFEIISESYDELKPIIQSRWPDNEALLDKKSWPTKLLMKCDTEKPEIVHSLSVKFREVFQKKVKEEKEKLETTKLYEENILWLQESMHLLELNQDTIKPLAERFWPSDVKVATILPMTLFNKCNQETDKVIVNNFIKGLKQILEEKEEEEKKKLLIGKLYEENMQWLQESSISRTLRPNLITIRHLAQKFWPGHTKVTRSLPMTLINKCNRESDKVKVNNFIEQLKQVLEAKSGKTARSYRSMVEVTFTRGKLGMKSQNPAVISSPVGTAHDVAVTPSKGLKEILHNKEKMSLQNSPVLDSFEKSDAHKDVIKQILEQYFLCEKESVMKLLFVLHKGDLLTADNLSTAQRNTEQGKFSASELMDLILSNCVNDWKNKLLVTCQNKDFPGDTFASILQTLLKREVISEDIKWFISAWNQVQKSNILIERNIADTWENEYSILTEYESWPLYLYEKCILEEEKMEVKEFLNAVKRVLQHDLTSKHPESEDDNSNIRVLDPNSSNEKIESATEVKAEDHGAILSPSEKRHEVSKHTLSLQQKRDSEDEALTLLEECKNWINKSPHLLKEHYQTLQPVARQLWQTDDHHDDVNKWFFDVSTKCYEEEDERVLSSFVESTKHAEQAKKVEEKHQSNIKWLADNLQSLQTNEEIVRTSTESVWPGDTRVMEKFPMSLNSKCKNETDLEKVNMFVDQVREKFREKDYMMVKSWLDSSSEFLMSNKHCTEMFPNNPEIFEKNWPSSLLTICKTENGMKEVMEFIGRAKKIMKEQARISSDSQKRSVVLRTVTEQGQEQSALKQVSLEQEMNATRTSSKSLLPNQERKSFERNEGQTILPAPSDSKQNWAKQITEKETEKVSSAMVNIERECETNENKEQITKYRSFIMENESVLKENSNIFKPIASKVWSMEKNITVEWPKKRLLKCSEETDPTKLQLFVGSFDANLNDMKQKQQASDEDAVSSRTRHHIMKETAMKAEDSTTLDERRITRPKKFEGTPVDEHRDPPQKQDDVSDKSTSAIFRETPEQACEWLVSQQHEDLRKYSDFAKEIVSKFWPTRNDIFNDGEWPFALISTCKKEANEDTVKLINKIKNYIELVKVSESQHNYDTSSDLQEDEYLIEFRMIFKMAEKGIVAWISFRHTNWEKWRMKFNDKKRYYYLQKKVKRGSLEYKYGSYHDDWESLQHDFNRLVNITEDRCYSKKKIILLDVASFSKTDSSPVPSSFGQYLPFLSTLGHKEVDLPSITRDIYAWVLQMMHGWKLIHYSSVRCGETINFPNWVNAISNWINQEVLPVWKSKNISCIVCILALCNALHHSKCSYEKPLLIELLKVMSTDELSEGMHQQLYKEIFQRLINDDFRSAAYPNIPDTIAALICKASSLQVSEFILILPLYQLIVHDGQVVRKLPRTDATDWRLAVSCLPRLKNMQWDSLRLNQRDVMNLLPKIMKFSTSHPWIVKAYQYILSYESLIKLIDNKEPICIHFNLEVILESFLHSTIKKFSNSASEIKKIFQNATQLSSSAVDESEGLNIELILTRICKLLNMLDEHERTSMEPDAIIVCLWICSNALELSGKRGTSDSDSKRYMEILDEILQSVYESVSKSKVDAKHWDDLLQITWTDGELSKDWTEKLCGSFKRRLDEHWLNNDEGYWHEYDSLSSSVIHSKRLESIFEDRAVQGLDNLLKNKENWLIYLARSALNKLFRGKKKNKVFNSFIHKQLSSYSDAIELVLKWPLSVKVLELLKNQNGIFSLDNEKRLKEVITVLDKLIADLISGKITVETFNLIYEHKSRIGELSPYFRSVCNVNVEALMGFRKSQLDAVIKAKDNLDSFSQCCTKLSEENVLVDVKELDDALSKRIKEMKISQLVKCSANLKDKEILVILYDKFNIKLDEIEKIGMLQKNIFFNHFWSVTATTLKQEWMNDDDDTKTISWKRVLHELWNSVRAQMLLFARKLDDGSMGISQLPKGLETISDEEIQKEIEQLYAFHDKCGAESTSNKRQRISDVHKWKRHKQSRAAIDALASIKDVLQLQGNFSSLVILTNEETAKITLREFSTHSSNVPVFSQANLDILTSFKKHRELLNWLKVNITGKQEIQPFCELAMSRISDSPMDIDRLSSFRIAVEGYSPLLFKLDEVRDVELLISRCKLVFQNCQEDQKLCHKWNSTGSHINWIEQIKGLLGRDNVQTMILAQKINENGIYVITCKDEEEVLSEGCLELKLQESGCENIYKLADLRDLQSKLMLIAGEKDARNHVVTYVDLLTAVESLDQVFVDLVSAGCMLFKNWKMEIASSIKSEFKFTMIFEEGCHPITGKGNLATIEAILSTMKKILDRWTEQMNNYRTHHYYLNEFNIKQITYLCRQLAKKHLISVPDQVTMLLARVKKSTTLAKITEALNEATTSNDDSDDEAESIFANNNESREDGKVSKMTKILRSLLKKHTCSLDLAKAAVIATNCEDIDSCTDWIVINRNNKKLIEENSTKFDQEIEFAHQSVDDFTIATVLHDRSTKSLKEVMNKLQEQEASKDNQAISSSLFTVYEKYNSSTANITLKDFLSVKHLGKFLSNLSQMRDRLPADGEALLERDMKPPLQKGKANLIICNENSILHQVLSLYMYSEKQPLPSTSEVLFCSEKTNQDEIERFFRRAMCKCSDRRAALFCLAFAHKLSHNVSEAADRIFIALSQSDINREFQLVIFSSEQRHYLTTCFDQYHTDVKLNEENQKITDYLAPHLKVDQGNLMKSAACIEENSHVVKVVYSHRSGVGKTLHVRRLKESLQSKMQSENNKSWHTTTIRFMEKTLNTDHVIDMLNPTDKDVLNADTHLIHLDFTPAVQEGVEQFAFNLLILGSIEDNQGRIWQRHQNHMYAVEITQFQSTKLTQTCSQHILEYLPKIRCLSPKEVVENEKFENCLPMDQIELRSDTIQRPFQYLLRHSPTANLDDFEYDKRKLNPDQKKCINTFLKYCFIRNPSWSQLRHFASFLNIQLGNCEKSIFCNKKIVGELGGLKSFAVSFMIKMAQDFATPSLSSADESAQDVAKNAFDHHQMRRKWEESSHPYIFFNDDGVSMTFINVNITREGHLVDRKNEIITKNAISRQLRANLIAQRVPLEDNFDSLNRAQKLMEICKVMGIKHTSEEIPDPDPTYELTTDNVLKILAIYMRFKCQIPVIIMGETGCGKTRMVEFISRLKAQNLASKAGARKAKTMITLKVHGGVTVRDVHQSIKDAEEVARNNIREYGLNTILFFDEANTTESIYAIKEVVCDLEVNGKSFQNSELQIVAACNPYKKLSDGAIKKLEKSGLGYRVRKEETKDKIGSIPMRTLVYRVVALPPSMQPLVWDFGQLADETEKIYIEQMMKKLSEKVGISNLDILSNLLSDVQCFMRKQRDETRYVSLRDVERCIISYQWFWNNKKWLYSEIVKAHSQKSICREMNDGTRTLIQVLGVCYHASLDNRESFRLELEKRLPSAGMHPYRQNEIKDEIVACQKALVGSMKMEKDIALNEALLENVFMIAVCADMKIPLYLVGKPGSSKSLAKTIVSDNMQGPESTNNMLANFKKVQVFSFQCSALTRAAEIEKVFNMSVTFQENPDNAKYSTILVLDEIGLAEDSPNMPLKVLHPLLESGSTKSEILINNDQTKKVAFVGISNWSLDPAKMNRGLFVTRKKPTREDLEITTGGFFQNTKETRQAWRTHNIVINTLASTYLKIYGHQEQEYFGLRDFYSLMKMVRPLCMKNRNLKMQDVMKAVVRNFSGGKKSYLEKFRKALKATNKFEDTDYAENSVQEIIEENLTGGSESRYLLLLTNQYSAVGLLHLLGMGKKMSKNFRIIFGSSFPGDNNYTEICRNINRIKICMESGTLVVILNLAEIHESLYDALNQHYVTFGGEKYVDLGLEDNRVKCRIHEEFKMIIMEKKEVVYNDYPTPLINRLEKHHFDSHSLLMHSQRKCAHNLKEWVKIFTSFKNMPEFDVYAAFPGYNDDTVSSIILTCDEKKDGDVEIYQERLMKCATMDSIFRLKKSDMLPIDVNSIQNCYFKRQSHDGLIKLMKDALKLPQESIPIYEVTTYSNVLSEKDRTEVEKQLCFNKNSVMLLSLQQFETEQQFSRKLDDFFKKCQKAPEDSAVLLIQCSQAHLYRQLISCARYCLTNKRTQFLNRNENRRRKVIVAFLLSTDRQTGNLGNKALVLQHTTDGEVVFIDELRPTMKLIGPASCFYNLTLREVFENSLDYLPPNGKPEEFLDIVSLLKDCVSEAVNKLQFENGKQDLTMLISMLMKLFQDRDFSRAIIQKICTILLAKEKSEETADHHKWIIDKAFSPEHLLEGGTFRKTIWLSLKQHATLYLAYITSIIHADDNLDHMKEDSVQWIRTMWLRIFNEYPILHVKEIRNDKSFAVSSSLLRGSYTFQIPFITMSFRVLYSTWTNISGDVQEKKYRVSRFLKSVRNQPTYSVMKEAHRTGGGQMEDAFISDVVRLMYYSDPISEDKLEAVDKIVNYFVKSRCVSAKVEEAGDGLANIFLTIIDLKKYLKTLADIFEICPELVENTHEWIRRDPHQTDFVIHQYALSDMMKLIRERSVEISDVDVCKEWIKLARKVKRIFHDHFKSDEYKEADDANWRQISFLYYFLTSILPSMSDEAIQTHYTKVIAEQANLLSKGCKKRDLQSKEYVLLVCGTLGMCYDEIKMKLLLSWQDSFCKVCLSKLENAVVLPCKHFLCVSCSDKSCKSESKICPTCAERIPSDYEPKKPVHSEESLAQLKDLKSNCTSFFLRFLYKFIFQKRGTTDSDDVPDLLMKELLAGSDGNQDLDLSAIDLNVNFLGYILKELIDYRGKDDMLDSYIRSENSDLVIVALRLFESQLLDNQTIDICSGRWDSDVLYQKFSTLRKNEKLCLDLIEIAAEIRLGIEAMSYYLHVILDKPDKRNFEMRKKIDSVIDFLNSDETDTLKLFFIKCGCVQFGTEWFSKLLESKFATKLVPRYLEGVRNETIDYWMLLGKEYASEKVRLHAVLPRMNREQQVKVYSCLKEVNCAENLIKTFSVLSWMSNRQDTNPERKFLKSCAKSKISFPDILASVYDVLSAQKVLGNHEKKILLHLLPMVAAAVLNRKHLVKEFYCFLKNPKSLLSMYLPAMPESLYFMLPKELRTEKLNVLEELHTEIYTCPNGHIYTITDCTHPVLESKCNECGAVIGGIGYRPADGNKRFVLDEKTQTGYMLEEVKPPRQNMAKPEDRMSKQGVAVTQALLHSCMIFALLKKKKLVSSFSKQPNMTSDRFMEFIINQLMKNLQDLSAALSKNMDETLIIMHKILLHIIRVQLPADLPQERCDWSSAESREAWEQQFRELYLLPVLQNVDQQIADGWSLLNEGMKLGNEKLYRLTHDMDLGNRALAIPKAWHNTKLWKTILHPNAAQLLQTIQDKHTVQSVVIQIILDFPQLGLLYHLMKVLKLQKYLIEKYQYIIDMNKADEITFAEYCEAIKQKDEKVEVEGLINNYFIIFKAVFPALRAKLEKDPDFNIRLTKNCSISLAMPSERGRGKYAKMLVEHLIDIQNGFLSKCEEKMGKGLKLQEVAVVDLDEIYLVCIDKHKDFLPLCKLHTSYHIISDENGSQHRISYNICAFEKRLREKYVLYKKYIKKSSIPCIQYPQDVGIGADWDKLRKSIPQVPLDQKLGLNMDIAVGNTRPAELYEGVRSLAHVISFLTKVPTEPERILIKYMEEDLMLSQERVSVVPRNAKIKHILAIYERLSLHKAKQFVSQGLNPYKEYFRDGQENIPPEVDNRLKAAFKDINVILLQQRLNETLLKKTDYMPEWSLLEDIFPNIDDYLDFIHEDNSWYKNLPKELCFKHIVDLFRLSEEFLRKNQ